MWPLQAFTWLNEHPGQVAEGQGLEGSVGHPQAVRPGPFIRKERNNEEGHSSLSGPTAASSPTPPADTKGQPSIWGVQSCPWTFNCSGLGPDPPLPCSSRASRLFHAAAR